MCFHPLDVKFPLSPHCSSAAVFDASQTVAQHVIKHVGQTTINFETRWSNKSAACMVDSLALAALSKSHSLLGMLEKGGSILLIPVCHKNSCSGSKSCSIHCSQVSAWAVGVGDEDKACSTVVLWATKETVVGGTTHLQLHNMQQSTAGPSFFQLCNKYALMAFD